MLKEEKINDFLLQGIGFFNSLRSGLALSRREGCAKIFHQTFVVTMCSLVHSTHKGLIIVFCLAFFAIFVLLRQGLGNEIEKLGVKKSNR